MVGFSLLRIEPRIDPRPTRGGWVVTLILKVLKRAIKLEAVPSR